MSRKTDSFPFRRGSNMGLWFSQANVLDEQHLASFYCREHIALAIVDTTQEMRPAITLAVTQERTSGGWYPIGQVEISL